MKLGGEMHGREKPLKDREEKLKDPELGEAEGSDIWKSQRWQGFFTETKRVGGKKGVGLKFEAVKQDR